MEDTLGIYSIEELYKRIKPALYSKKQELKRSGIDFVKEVDIWNYLSQNNWNKKEELSISQMVSDIFNLESYKIKNYVMEILKNTERKIDKKDDNLL